MIIVALIFVAYLLGSIPAAVWISRAFYGQDIRTLGSQNAGSTNMYRVFGWKPGLATQLIDIAKGTLAALLPYFFMNDLSPEALTINQLACGFAAVIGHVYTVFADFRGGKGVNTALGMVFAIHPLSSCVALGVFLLVFLTGRMVSAGSMSGALSFPIFLSINFFALGQPMNLPLYVFSFVIAILVVYTHRANIERIKNGTESRVSFGKKK